VEKIGVVGLGNMGFNIAKTLLRHGSDVVGYDIRHEQIDRLIELGGTGAPSAQEVAEKAGIVILSLPNSPITEEVVLGERGILSGVGHSLLVIDMGSSVPSSTKMLGARLAEKGARMVDAAVSGGPSSAEAGTLAIIIGGAKEDIDRAMPIFEVLGAPEKVTVVGPLGSGHMLKAINNYVYASSLWVSSEAFVVAAKAGLDANIVQKVLSTSSGRNRAVEDNIPNQVLDRSFPPSFALGLLNKDVNTFYAIAKELDVPTPVGALLKEMYGLGVKEIGADAGDSKIITVLEKWAGVEVRGRQHP
jgi:3-hydroxyisobutyrate dehydrogenase-like beta-hydroxyacid dehydrogenase